MALKIEAPVFPESIADGEVAEIQKNIGDYVGEGDILAEVETDKVNLEVPAIKSGKIVAIHVAQGDTVETGHLMFEIDETAEKPADAPAQKTDDTKPAAKSDSATAPANSANAGPAARRAAGEAGVDTSQVEGTGRGGRVTAGDVMTFAAGGGSRSEKRVPMTRLRQRIAERLLSAQHETAMLTTFNEINMKPVMDLRKQYQDKFTKDNGIKLGFMSFFIKAATEALRRSPAVNSSIDGTDVVYHGYTDIGVAVSTEKGLVVPILRNTETMSMAEMEKSVVDYSSRARDGKLALEEMTGGTFTITNGGVFGSLLSTPILNPPQSAILGMHSIQERPVVENGEIVIRPMMYVALSYDHRVIDGKESVTFLKTIKELLEDPARFLLGL